MGRVGERILNVEDDTRLVFGHLLKEPITSTRAADKMSGSPWFIWDGHGVRTLNFAQEDALPRQEMEAHSA